MFSPASASSGTLREASRLHIHPVLPILLVFKKGAGDHVYPQELNTKEFPIPHRAGALMSFDQKGNRGGEAF